ncbi:MAG: sigma-70 family RNA polymerase sigma factor [Cytophagales bacterium]|nr:sigma-70 family RNA polymerase sigma factor [Cytophagales bacterium]
MVTAEQNYDVFFSYCREDADLVEKIAISIRKKAKIKIWLDKWVLVPGQPFRRELEKGIDGAKSCAVFIGAQTPKGWVEEELNTAIGKQISDRSFRVIPVLLPDADAKNLNGFLSSRTWVDFKKGIEDADAINLLICGISGTPPGKPTTKKQPKAKPNADEEVDFVLTIQGDLETYTAGQKKALMDAILTILGSGRTITVKHMGKGSIKMTLGLKRSEAERLKEAIEKGELAQFNVTGAVIIDIDTTGESEGIAEMKTASLDAALRKGDGKAWADLYRKYRPMIMQMVKVNGGTVKDAADVYLAAVIQLFQKMQAEPSISDLSIKTYLYAICKNLWIDRVRKSGSSRFKFKEVAREFGLAEEQSLPLNSPETEKVIDKVIDELDEPCRRLLIGYYFEGKSPEQLAQQFGYSSTNAAKDRKFRCIQELRKKLDKKQMDSDQ